MGEPVGFADRPLFLAGRILALAVMASWSSNPDWCCLGLWPGAVAAALGVSRMYLTVKYVHVVSVVLSLTGFFLRGILMMLNSPLLSARWIRVVPHINDTVLLVAALLLATMTAQYPFVADWVTAKVLGVIAYIILGALALRDASTRRMRIACWFASLAVFGWIVSVALTRQPMGFLTAVIRGV